MMEVNQTSNKIDFELFAQTSPTALPETQIARELAVWLRALKSFLQLRFQPTHDETGSQALTRGWEAETRIAQRTLLRTAHLAKQLNMQSANAADEDDSVFDHAFGGITENAREGVLRETFNVISGAPLIALAAHLENAASVADAMLKACDSTANNGGNSSGSNNITGAAYLSFGRLVTTPFEHEPTYHALREFAREQARQSVHPNLIRIAAHAQPPELAADMMSIFASLTELLELLQLIEPLLKKDLPLKQTLPLWTLIHEDTIALLEYISERALKIENLPETIFDALDGTSYAIGMESKKAFAHELIGVSESQHAPTLYTKIENTHGLLRDCFQQSIVTLAQTFDESLAPNNLFNASHIKLEQSIALRRDVWLLLKEVRAVERERDADKFGELIKKFEGFRQSSMRLLMYKDWEAYERFIDEATAARGAAELIPVLHRFATYLETLFGQINMRAVLAAHPFEDGAP